MLSVGPIAQQPWRGTVAEDAVLAGIEYAGLMGARVINLSLGARTEPDPLYTLAIRDVSSALVVAAAGNDGVNNNVSPMEPASVALPNVVAVAASAPIEGFDVARAPFSAFGNLAVELAAPGMAEEVVTTLPTLDLLPSFTIFILAVPLFSFDLLRMDLDDDGLLDLGGTAPEIYGNFLGTSAATPHVAGVAALMLAERPDLTPSDLKNCLVRSVDRTVSLVDVTVGGGRLNARRALECAQNCILTLPPSIDLEAVTEEITAPSVSLFPFGELAPGEVVDVVLADLQGSSLSLKDVVLVSNTSNPLGEPFGVPFVPIIAPFYGLDMEPRAEAQELASAGTLFLIDAAAGDIDGDGLGDLVLTGSTDDPAPTRETGLFTFFGTGAGPSSPTLPFLDSVQFTVPLSSGVVYFGAAVVDLAGDSVMRIVTTHVVTAEPLDRVEVLTYCAVAGELVLEQQVDVTEAIGAGTLVTTARDQLIVGDFNLDDRLDVMALIDAPVHAVVLPNVGEGMLEENPELIAVVDFPVMEFFFSADLGDFNRDGVLDVVVAEFDDQVALALGRGDGSFEPAAIAVTLTAGNFDDIAVGDFNRDCVDDLAWVDENTIAIRPGNGVGGISAGASPGSIAVDLTTSCFDEASRDPGAITTVDRNGDGYDDLVVALAAGDAVGCNSAVAGLVFGGP